MSACLLCLILSCSRSRCTCTPRTAHTHTFVHMHRFIVEYDGERQELSLDELASEMERSRSGEDVRTHISLKTFMDIPVIGGSK